MRIVNPLLDSSLGQPATGTRKTGFFFVANLLCAAVLCFNLGVGSVRATGMVVAWGDNDSY
jgi:UDP-N-acetylmuramyl tripeptide synthase